MEFNIPNSVISVGAYDFDRCVSITNISIGTGVRTIGEYAFKDCISLPSLVIPNNVESIGRNILSGTKKLESLFVPFIGSERGNNNSKESVFAYFFDFDAPQAPYTYNDLKIITNEPDTINFYKTVQYYQSEYSDGYSTMETWGYIPRKLKMINITDETIVGVGAFMQMQDAVTINLNEGITLIDDYAFYKTQSFRIMNPDSDYSEENINTFGINIPVSVTTIGDYAFADMNALTRLRTPSQDMEFETYVFAYNHNLVNLKLTNKLIGEHMFDSCDNKNFTTLVIPKITHKVLYSISHNSPIISIDEINGDIRPYAFANCTGLTTISFEIGDNDTNGANYLGKYMFANCTGIEELYVTDNIKYIDEAALYMTTSLHTLVLPFVGAEVGIEGTEESLFGWIFGYNASASSDLVEQVTQIRNIDDHTLDVMTSIPKGLVNLTVTDETVVAYGAFSNIKTITNYVFDNIDVSNINQINNQILEIIGAYAFYNSGITYLNSKSTGDTISVYNINMPSNVKEIRTHAFADCQNIISLRTTSTMTEDVIEDYIFTNCDSLVNILFENSYIGVHMFDDCDALINLTISKCVTNVGDYAFANCDLLANLTFENEYIGKYMFSNCPSLVNVEVANCVKIIDFAAFDQCYNIENLTIPFVGRTRDIEYSEQALFTWIFGQYDSYATEDFVDDIDDVFETNTMIVAVHVSKDDSAAEMKEVIGVYPEALKNLTITDETLVGYGAFSDVNVANINFTNTNDSETRFIKTFSDYSFYQSGVVNLNNDSNYNIVIPTSVDLIKSHAFDSCYNIESLKLGEKLHYDSSVENAIEPIGEYAFANEAKLVSILFENNFTSQHMFDSDTALKDVTISDTIEVMRYAMLSNCSSIERITMPFIGEVRDNNETNNATLGWLFGDSILETTKTMYQITQEYTKAETITAYIPSSLYSVTITLGNRTIDNGNSNVFVPFGTFDNVSTLREVYLPTDRYLENNNITVNTYKINEYAFRNTGLVDITIPSKVDEIKLGAFKNSARLEYVYFENGSMLTALGDEAFSGCTSLVLESLPYGVTSIGSEAFYKNTSMIRFNVPNSVETIGLGAFGLTTSLEEISIPFVGRHAYATTFKSLEELVAEDKYDYPDNGFDSRESLFGWIFGSKKEANGVVEAKQAWNSGQFDAIKRNNTTSSIDGVTYTPESFYVPVSLKRINLTESIGIGYGAFMNLRYVEEIVLPIELKFIGKYAFYGDWSLGGVDIPRGVEIIGDGAFANSGLEYVEVWNKTVSDSEFANCKRLHTAILHDTVEEIGYGVFTGCSLLENLTIPFVGEQNYNNDRQASASTSFMWILVMTSVLI